MYLEQAGVELQAGAHNAHGLLPSLLPLPLLPLLALLLPAAVVPTSRRSLELREDERLELFVVQ